MRILVYLETAGDGVADYAREMLAGARQLAGSGGTVDALLLAADAAGLAGKVAGADRVLSVSHPALAQYNPAAHAACLEAAIRETNPDLVLLAYTTAGLDVGPHVAIRTDRPLVSYCVKVTAEDGAVSTQSQMYGGKLIASARTPLPAMLMVNPGVFREEDAGSAPAGTVQPLAVPAALDILPVTFAATKLPAADAIDITRSERLVSVGRGIGEKDNIEEAREVAELIGAEIVGSRPVIDAGWLPKERQVGKSGRKVKPRLYLALGVSGAPEHLEGMKTAELIIAINQDPNAPIFDHAHYGAAIDLFDFLTAFKEKLEARGA